MKGKYRIMNLASSLRMAFVGGLSLGAAYLIGVIARNALDLVYRSTESQFLRAVFIALSQRQALLAFMILLLGLALFGGWILAPVFADFTEVVGDSLVLDGDMPELELPKTLGPLEARLREVNREMRLWRYAVREAEQRKDELVVYLAHDIRTPLTSVLGYLELVARHPELPEESRARYVQIALHKAERMQALVEELFEVTRFNISQVELDKRPVNAAMFVNQLAEEIAPLLEERGIGLRVDTGGVETMFIDADKVARAVENILQNAARYTPEGETVSIALEAAEDGRTRIAVRNTGQEISKEKLERFFEKFYRGDEARQSGTGGSGLGLAIARNLIEAHGGTLTAENRERVTTFTVTV